MLMTRLYCLTHNFFLKIIYFDEYSCEIYHSFALSSYFLFYVTISAKICDNIDVGVIFVHSYYLFLIIYFGCYGVFRLRFCSKISNPPLLGQENPPFSMNIESCSSHAPESNYDAVCCEYM